MPPKYLHFQRFVLCFHDAGPLQTLWGHLPRRPLQWNADVQELRTLHRCPVSSEALTEKEVEAIIANLEKDRNGRSDWNVQLAQCVLAAGIGGLRNSGTLPTSPVRFHWCNICRYVRGIPLGKEARKGNRMPSPDPVRKRSLIEDRVIDQNHEISGRDARSAKKADLTNEARVVSRVRVALPKPLRKAVAPTLA